ncbi:hypothetical protein ACI2KT_36450 [Ensifer adhaerens]|uniref:hypothetical protein n=1 Tax=Ensifer adhaerens TaxID=106592 RepID=UPI00384EAC45
MLDLDHFARRVSRQLRRGFRLEFHQRRRRHDRRKGIAKPVGIDDVAMQCGFRPEAGQHSDQNPATVPI